jgi:hypothetical protein
MRIFGQLLVLLVDKQKVPYLYPISINCAYIKQHLKSSNFCTSYATAVAMATMTFQDGGYFGF